ncbi:hypothetical protein GHT06_018391 [Daphnia sinensis]|uniref:Uncharacterized protein n=1 Tax=Daphnia sinensis TaxID=1820382 RepID=A0AAD5KMH7_9CRUS|nr:hypothetical protein GHT06_018391 [Daphnia sinensis]
MTQQHKVVWNYPGEIDRFFCYYCNYQLDGSEQPMESLSLIDAVMPDVVASRQQQTQNNQKPQVVKTEPPNSNGDEPMHSYRWEEETGVEISASKSTVLRGHESEVFICA